MSTEPSTEPRRTMPRGGKRCGMNRSEYLGDWFMSYSPRNSNSNAEGQWDHWVDMAIQILQHPATAIVRPEAHEIAAPMKALNFYSEAGVDLTDEQVNALFPEPMEGW